jgi:hypothetical protein
LIASATRQGWKVELSTKGGKWSWSAEKGGIKLSGAKEFDDFASARKDFLEAVF